MNVLDKSAINYCTSCGVCAVTCAKKAITISLNKDGFYRPIIDSSLCNDCGLCTSVCYKFEENVLKTEPSNLKEKKLYASWSNDSNVLNNTTSGGLGDLLAHQLLKDGYTVVGVIYNKEKDCAEHRIARDETDLLDFRGSKYIQNYTYDAFREVVENCKKEKFAVFGTPCQIYALNKLVTKRKLREQFVFIDIYCHGCPSFLAWKKFAGGIKQINRIERFDRVTFRSKKQGWGNYCLDIETGGNTIYKSKRVNDSFYELFFSDTILNESCYDCRVRNTLEYCDIRLGDFWGKSYLTNKRGVSAVSLSTKVGEEVFNKIESVHKELKSHLDLLPYQSWNKTYSPNTNCRDKVLLSLRDPEQSIKDAILVLRNNQGVKASIIRRVKYILSIFPQGITKGIKKVIYSVRNI